MNGAAGRTGRLPRCPGCDEPLLPSDVCDDPICPERGSGPAPSAPSARCQPVPRAGGCAPVADRIGTEFECSRSRCRRDRRSMRSTTSEAVERTAEVATRRVGALLGRRGNLDRDGQITDVDRIAAEKGSTGNPHLRVGDPPETAPLLRSVRSARPWTDSPVESRSRSCHSDLISETLFRPLPLGLCRRLVAAARRSGSIHSP